MYETLQNLLECTPFKPLRVRMASGEVYTIERRDSAMLMKSTLVIGWPKKDRSILCDLPQIATVQLLQRKQTKQ